MNTNNIVTVCPFYINKNGEAMMYVKKEDHCIHKHPFKVHIHDPDKTEEHIVDVMKAHGAISCEVFYTNCQNLFTVKILEGTLQNNSKTILDVQYISAVMNMFDKGTLRQGMLSAVSLLEFINSHVSSR